MNGHKLASSLTAMSLSPITLVAEHGLDGSSKSPRKQSEVVGMRGAYGENQLGARVKDL